MPNHEKEQLINVLAEVQHEIWAHWMKYLYSKCEEYTIELEGKKIKTGNLIIPVEEVAKWRRQMHTPYSQLSPKEQQSDQKIVKDFVLPVILKTSSADQ